MYSLFLASKLDRDEERERAANAKEEAAVGAKHRTKRNRLAEHYHSRVEEWVATQLEEMKLPEEEVPVPLSARRAREKVPHIPELMFRTRNKEQELAGAVISPRTYQTERQRLAPVIARSESRQAHPLWPPYEAYKHASQTEAQLRVRQPSKELGPPIRHVSGLSTERVNDVITFRDIGGRSVEWQQPPQYPSFREKEQPHRWRGEGRFLGRFPEVPKLGENSINTLREEEPFAPRIRNTRDLSDPSQDSGRPRWNQHRTGPHRPDGHKELGSARSTGTGRSRYTATEQQVPQLSSREKAYWRGVESLALTGSLRPESPERSPRSQPLSARTMRRTRPAKTQIALPVAPSYDEEEESKEDNEQEEVKEEEGTKDDEQRTHAFDSEEYVRERERARQLWHARGALALS